MNVRGDAPFPPRLIHHRVRSAAIRRYRTLRAHPAWTRQLEQPQHAPRLRTTPRAAIPTDARARLGPERAPLPAPLGGAGGRLRSRSGCGAPLPSPRGSRGDLELCNNLQNFYLPFLQKLQRKLSTPLCRPRLGLRQRPPARGPQLLPRRPAFVLLPHPALEPGRNSRIPLRAWGAAGARPLSGPSRPCPRVPARVWANEPGAPRSRRPLPQPRSPRRRRRRAPVCARVPPRLAVSRPPGASLLRWGNWGPGVAHAPPARTPRGGGLGIGVFSLPGLAPLPARPPPPPGWKASSHLRGDSGWPPGRLAGLRGERKDRSATCAHHA